MNALLLVANVVLKVSVDGPELRLDHLGQDLSVMNLLVVQILQLDENLLQARVQFRFLVTR